MKKKTTNLEADEKALLESVERGEWQPVKSAKRARARYARDAKATFRKDRRVNIRLSSKDLEVIQRRAIEEGLPYQTLNLEPAAQVRVRPPQRGMSRTPLKRTPAAASTARTLRPCLYPAAVR